MKHTKEQLEAMSDLNINKEVARLTFDFYDEIRITQAPSKNSSVWVECDGGLENTNYDPCNNPSEMMHLVFESGLAVNPMIDSRWSCQKVVGFNADETPDFSWKINAAHKNPLRACAIVYILINQ